MKENDNKYLEDFTKKVVKNTTLESPSVHFTSEIMSQVTALNDKSITVYKPLISKNVWCLIALGFILLCAYFILVPETQQSSRFDAFDFSAFTNNKFSSALSGITVSKTLAYAVALFGLMFAIQIPILKHYFDKRLNV